MSAKTMQFSLTANELYMIVQALSVQENENRKACLLQEGYHADFAAATADSQRRLVLKLVTGGNSDD